MQSILKEKYIRASEHPDYLEHIGRAIHTKRTRKDMSIKKLSELSGVSTWTIGQYENNNLAKVETIKLSAIAKALNCETRDLVGRGKYRKNTTEPTYHGFEFEEEPMDMLTLEETILRDRPLSEKQYIKIAFQQKTIDEQKVKEGYLLLIIVLLGLSLILSLIFN